jgi:hypothetical protein
MKCTWKAPFVTAITGGILNRSVDVTLTDPFGRTVAGLEKSQFAVFEGGVQRTITAFTQRRDEDPKPHSALQVGVRFGDPECKD